MTGRLVALTPTLKPVGGVVKVFDYAEHLLGLGFDVTICTPDEVSSDLPLFAGDRYPDVRPGGRVQYRPLEGFGLDPDDWVLFSWPSHYRVISTKLPPGYDLRRTIHLVQNVRHANPDWIDGEAARLLARPMTRVFVASAVYEACLPLMNARSPSFVVPEGHRWEYFHLIRDTRAKRPIDVGYTTWKSDVGERVASTLEHDGRFTFRAITEPVGWPELRALYHACDVFLGTPGPEEGLYLPGLEAMAAGAVVIIPDAGGNMEYCDFGVNCLRAEFEDEDSYVAALNQLADDQPLMSKLRSNGYSTLEKHTLESERNQVVDLIGILEAMVE